MHKLNYIIYIPPQVIKLKYFMNLRDKDNLRRKDKSAVPKVSFLRRFHSSLFVQKESLSERPNSPRGTYSSNTLVHEELSTYESVDRDCVRNHPNFMRGNKIEVEPTSTVLLLAT